MRDCMACGASIEGKRSHAKVCSDKCYKQMKKQDCRTCGKEITRGRIDRKRYCDRLCYARRNGLNQSIPCMVCGKESYRSQSRMKITSKTFCSMACRNKGMTGSNSVRFHLGSHIDKDGYRVCVMDGKRGLEHTMVAEKSLGRALWRREVVHHINGIKTDNRPENLIVCSQSMHRRIHDFMGRLYMNSIPFGKETTMARSLLEQMYA